MCQQHAEGSSNWLEETKFDMTPHVAFSVGLFKRKKTSRNPSLLAGNESRRGVRFHL